MRPTARSFSILAFIAFLIVSPTFASESDHKYQLDDPVTLWVNKVGPYNNPQETYNYYSLPFCHPTGEMAHKWGGLGEVLGGTELIDSQIGIKFQRNVEKTTICELEFDEANVKQFKDAIESSYWFEFFMGFGFHFSYIVVGALFFTFVALFLIFFFLVSCTLNTGQTIFLYGVLSASSVLTRTVITRIMCFTHIKTLLLNTTRIRSFMLISLKRALKLWKCGEWWT